MPTYRVYIAKPGTAVEEWDWQEIVVDSDVNKALLRAYNDWIRIDIHPVPLNICRTRIDWH